MAPVSGASLLLSLCLRLASLTCTVFQAWYGCDLMVDVRGDVWLLEVNYCPDLESAVRECPTFVDDALRVLFLDDGEPVSARLAPLAPSAP
jgi:hypothetical protein